MNFDVSRLKDPLFFAENRVAAHSDHVAYASMEELSHGETSLRCSLNGLWKFHHALNAGQVIPGFEAADYDSRGWADIHVPAHIQMEGYGAPQYANVQYPWDGYQAVEIGEIPQEYNPVASYIKTFFVPAQMASGSSSPSRARRAASPSGSTGATSVSRRIPSRPASSS